ncbi:MAG: tRNA (adenine-N1)-methyltransferase [Desulfovibrionaceae bacterium]|nr:tRNA (adenine-N1)-methyltransferase [Desulfovibrionaceae bacterium]MBF0514095.1 tRNA (adenine-N1)-methyltransferase [Desulfovibrionaceae bacterium]
MLEQGQLALLVSQSGTRYLRLIVPGEALHTQDGVLSMDAVLAAGYGGVAASHLGRPYRVIRPTLYDLAKGVKRATQIIYPKDIGYIVLKLGIGPGTRVVEAGSGSGSLTLVMAWLVGDQGKVYTFERRAEFSRLCGDNLDRAGVGQRVVRFHHDIADGFVPPGVEATQDDPSGADALFLDVRTPWDYLDQAASVVAPGSPIGFLLPTANQVSDLLAALETSPFEDVEVLEILVRRYKPVAERLRPDDRMVAHTGYLMFARHKGADFIPPEPALAREPGAPAAGAADQTGQTEQSGQPDQEQP